MNKTKIEWVKNPDGSQGYTWNPITGCLNHVNGFCKGGDFPCYAYKLAHTRLKQRYYANKELPPDALLGRIYDDPFYPRFWEEKLLPAHRIGSASYRDRKAKGGFVCDMGDLFGIGIPGEWQQRVLSSIKTNPLDRFYLLTKQPQNLIKFSPFPDNAWVGVTATNTDMLLNAINCLEEVKAQVKYISLEPLLSWADTSKWVYPLADSLKGLSWLIIGACTGSLEDIKKVNYAHKDTDGLMPMPWGKRWTLQPRLEWVREIVEAADHAGVKVFLKDNLSDIVPLNTDREPFLRYGAAGELRLRQEMPVV